jgi:hypothetical protein
MGLTVADPAGAHGKRFRRQPFESLMDELAKWRLDPDIASMPQGERPLGFIRGLRLSAQLIYLLRDLLSETDLEVDWGHILSDDEETCSPECDVIIHRPGYVGRWNGHERPVMDVRFVTRHRVLAVVSCKSKLRQLDQREAVYCQKLREYVETAYLFAECCPPTTVGYLRQRSAEIGYAGFYCLYTYDEGSGEADAQEPGWADFVQRIVALG